MVRMLRVADVMGHTPLHRTLGTNTTLKSRRKSITIRALSSHRVTMASINTRLTYTRRRHNTSIQHTISRVTRTTTNIHPVLPVTRM